MPPVPEPIESARLSLRPLRGEAGEFALYRALYCDPGVMRHIARPLPATRVAASFAASCDDAAAAPTFASRWCVRRKHDAHGIGLLGAFHDPTCASVELGIMLLPEVQARGFAGEALAVMISALAQRPDAVRFWSRHRPANRPMARVLERLGFARGHDQDGLWRWELTASATRALAADAAAR